MFFITVLSHKYFVSSYFLGEMNLILNYTGKADLIHSLIQSTIFINHQSWGKGILMTTLLII